MSIAVSIIEDDYSVRQYLAGVISSSPLCILVGTARNRAEAMALIEKNITDIFLVDLGLPDVDGIDLIAKIKVSCGGAQSLVLSTFGDIRHVSRSIRAGAMGYLLKEERDSVLIDKIVALQNGLSPVSPLVASMLFQHVGSGKILLGSEINREEAVVRAGLGAREVQVLKLLAMGLSVVAIADKIFISTHTVNQHLRSIYRKLEVRSRSMAVYVAQKNGILAE